MKDNWEHISLYVAWGCFPNHHHQKKKKKEKNEKEKKKKKNEKKKRWILEHAQ